MFYAGMAIQVNCEPDSASTITSPALDNSHRATGVGGSGVDLGQSNRRKGFRTT
jgi:hypothetical protein